MLEVVTWGKKEQGIEPRSPGCLLSTSAVLCFPRNLGSQLSHAVLAFGKPHLHSVSIPVPSLTYLGLIYVATEHG